MRGIAEREYYEGSSHVPYEIIDDGWIVRSGELETGRVAAGPRLAVLPDGQVLCSCMLQEKLGQNDFVPMLYRSLNEGKDWQPGRSVWPHLERRWSIFANISRDDAGRLYLFGSRTPIDTPCEPFWSDATQGLKQNELFWAVSDDAGETWCDPQPIAMPVPGAAEAPGAMQILTSGRWIAPYSPYNTFDPNLQVERNQAIVVYSDDAGATWRHSTMFKFPSRDSSSAEAWIVEFEPNHLLATGWHIDLTGHAEHPNAFATSFDGGTTWSATGSTDIRGQSTALARLSDGRALFIYNQRKHGDIGVWLAIVRPEPEAFRLDENALIWKAPTRTRSGTSGEHAQWTDFSFGEPSIAVLNDGTLLAALWCIQPDGRGIRYVHLRMS